jgi:hypothetical protein
MKAQTLDTQEATHKFFAARDASIKSYAASTSYTEAQKLQAERMKLGLELVYRGTAFYITFRKKFITVKVEGASVRDRAALRELEAVYEVQGVTKIETAQGIAYRITKQ